ncbi:MAG: cupin domain-containing protein [Ruminococcaceae bacterium]|nr:cupin domain-containing protein [Oscillospiraceae bacterium]
MIKKLTEMPVSGHDNWCRGRGHADALHLLTAEETRGRIRDAMLITVEKGGFIGDHPHVDDADLYYIIEGTARVDDNGVLKEITAGELSYTQEGEHHSIENIGDGELKFLALVLR